MAVEKVAFSWKESHWARVTSQLRPHTAGLGYLAKFVKDLGYTKKKHTREFITMSEIAIQRREGLPVETLETHQLAMRALLSHAAVWNHTDHVGILDRVQAMRYDNTGPPCDEKETNQTWPCVPMQQAKGRSVSVCYAYPSVHGPVLPGPQFLIPYRGHLLPRPKGEFSDFVRWLEQWQYAVFDHRKSGIRDRPSACRIEQASSWWNLWRAAW